MKVRTTLAALLLMLPGGAFAQGSSDAAAQKSCVIDTVTPALAKEIGGLVLGDARGTPYADDHPAFVRLGEIAADCAERHGWSETMLEAAAALAVTQITIAPTREALQGAGVDPKLLEKAFRELPVETRRQFTVEPISDAAIAAFLARSSALGLTIETEEQGVLVGVFGGLLAFDETSGAAFELR